MTWLYPFNYISIFTGMVISRWASVPGCALVVYNTYNLRPTIRAKSLLYVENMCAYMSLCLEQILMTVNGRLTKVG